MDPRQYNMQEHAQSGQQNPRFSWQMAPDDEQQQRQQRQPLQVSTDPQQHDAPPNGRSPRFSYVSTPVEHQQPTFPRVQHQPTEPSIPQSPDTVFEDQDGHTNAQQQQQQQQQYPQHPQHDYPYDKDPARLNGPYTVPQPTQQHPALDPYANKTTSPRSPPPQAYGYSQQKPTAPTSPTVMKTAGDAPTSPHTPNRPRELYIPHREHTTRAHDQPIFSPDAPVGPNGPPSAQHLPGQIAHPNMSSATGHKTTWKHSIFSCGAPSDCMTGLFCPCILYGKTSYRLERKSSKEDATDVLGWDAANWRCGLMALACGAWCLFPLIHRTRIRHLYNIEGGVGEDVLAGCCCCCCVTVQNEREVREREEARRRWAGPATEMQYTREQGMVYGQTM